MSQKRDQMIVLEDGLHTSEGLAKGIYYIDGFNIAGHPYTEIQVPKPKGHFSNYATIPKRIAVRLENCKILQVVGVKIRVLRVNNYTKQAVEEGGVYEIDGYTIEGYPFIKVPRTYENWNTDHKCVIPIGDVEFIGLVS